MNDQYPATKISNAGYHSKNNHVGINRYICDNKIILIIIKHSPPPLKIWQGNIERVIKMQMLDIYLCTEGRKNRSVNLRTLNLLGFKVRPTQEKKNGRNSVGL